jgi:ATP-binding cassette subfamily F protein uup
MGVILSVYQVQKSIGARVLFKDLTFGLNSGDRVGLVGPNGAGKSTLMRCLAGLDHVDKGQMTWSGSLKVAYVPQNPRFEATQTVRQFLSPKHDLDMDEEVLAWELFSKFDVPVYDFDQKYSEFSGGEQKKIQIIQAFIQKPDVLLMDEPTNHLDVESIMRLEEFLESKRDVTFFIISHDRLFLQNVVGEVMDLDARYKDGYIRVRGGYAEYLEASREVFRVQNVTQQKLENDLRWETAWLRRGAKARQTKQTARKEAAYALAEEVDLLNELNRKKKIQLELKSHDHMPKKLMELENLSLGRGDRIFFKHLNLVISGKTRLGLLGKNGSGKSTLIKALMDETDQAHLICEGKIKRYDELNVSYFEQQRSLLNFNETLLNNVCPDGDYVHVQGTPIFGRSYLDRFRFRRDQHDLKVKELSGGEQNRLLIAILMTQKAQLMILDEPTNDLDFETLEVLKQSLLNYDGAVILVTHDRTFMDEVCDDVLYFPEESSGQKELIRFASFLQWQDWKNQPVAQQNQLLQKQKENTSAPVKNEEAPVKSATAKGPKLSFKEQREYEGIEAIVLGKESQLTEMQNEIAKPEVASDSSKLVTLSKSIADLEAEIEKLYARWQELEARAKA